MKKNILILSATGNSNYNLAKEIESIVLSFGVEVRTENIEDYNLPLFTASDYLSNKKKYLNKIKTLTKKMINAHGLIICAPEYNGSIPPIITNAIAWISVSTDYWRDAFENKIGLIASSSGGPATKFQIAMQNQLEHLGMIVIPRKVSVSSKVPLKLELAKKILEQLIKHI